MCNNEALANRILDMVEKYGLDSDGRLDSERSRAMIVSILIAENPAAEDEFA
jgi:hypothetical protein